MPRLIYVFYDDFARQIRKFYSIHANPTTSLSLLVIKQLRTVYLELYIYIYIHKTIVTRNSDLSTRDTHYLNMTLNKMTSRRKQFMSYKQSHSYLLILINRSAFLHKYYSLNRRDNNIVSIFPYLFNVSEAIFRHQHKYSK